MISYSKKIKKSINVYTSNNTLKINEEEEED